MISPEKTLEGVVVLESMEGSLDTAGKIATSSHAWSLDVAAGIYLVFLPIVSSI